MTTSTFDSVMGHLGNFVDKLKPAVAKAAEALSTTAEGLWTIGIAKQYVDGFIHTALAIFGLLCSIIGIIFAKKMISWVSDGEWGHKEDRIGVAVLSSGALIIGGFSLFFPMLYYAILHLLVPQYTLILEVLTYIK